MQKRRLVIIGAGGQGKVNADIALNMGYTEILFLDDGRGGMCLDFPIVGKVAAVPEFNDGNTDFALAIGDSRGRRCISDKYDLPWVTLVHPSAQIGRDAQLGRGCVIMAGAVIGPSSKIGDFTMINTCASVDHDCVIGNYVHIAVGAHVAGTVTVGDNTWLGIGAVVSNNLAVAQDCMIGAGAVVVRDLAVPGVYMGVPARLAEHKE